MALAGTQINCKLMLTPLCLFCGVFLLLQGLVLPAAVAADVELASLMLRACPFTDDEELLPICYRCQATNTLLNTQVRTHRLALGMSQPTA